MDDQNAATLTARPHEPTRSIGPGTHAFGFGDRRDGALFVPPGLSEAPAPLLVALHGAGGSASDVMMLFAALAELHGFLLLALDSRGRSWDRRGDADVRFLDRALAWTFDRVAVDPERLVISGFSDGASYALTVGLANGDLFPRIVALSPGYAAPLRREGRPAVYVAHGSRDRVLPVRCSHTIVAQLEREGYPVRYHEFADDHTIPPDIAVEALRWALAA